MCRAEKRMERACWTENKWDWLQIRAASFSLGDIVKFDHLQRGRTWLRLNQWLVLPPQCLPKSPVVICNYTLRVHSSLRIFILVFILTWIWILHLTSQQEGCALRSTGEHLRFLQWCMLIRGIARLLSYRCYRGHHHVNLANRCKSNWFI